MSFGWQEILTVVVVVLVVFGPAAVLTVGAYLFGRSRGREEGRAEAHVLGPEREQDAERHGDTETAGREESHE